LGTAKEGEGFGGGDSRGAQKYRSHSKKTTETFAELNILEPVNFLIGGTSGENNRKDGIRRLEKEEDKLGTNGNPIRKSDNVGV